MVIEVRRKWFTEKSTISEIFINGLFECYALEDKDRGLLQSMALKEIETRKLHAKTAIPYGEYNLVVTMSNRFKKELPLVMDVPGFAGIRIHPGNRDVDTEGCLLPGEERGLDQVLKSKLAFEALFKKIRTALDAKESVKIKYTKAA